MLIALWAVPRSASTAFERMCIERGDLEVVHEPFSRCWYLGPDAQHPRYQPERPNPEHAYLPVRDSLLAVAEGSRPVFFKDMAYHVVPWHEPAFMARLRSGFLIRHPRLVLASMARKMPDFTLVETGFPALERLFHLERERLGEVPPLVDAGALCTDPAGQIAAWCAAMGLPFLPESLDWQPGLLPRWQIWEEWHRDVARTTGFAPPRDPATAEVPAEHTAALDICMDIYNRLLQWRIES